VIVLDFGIAKVAQELGANTSAVHTADGAMLGTPFYMSPEQIYGEPDVDHRSDILSLGVILYECLTGCRPTQGATIGQVLKVITQHQIVPIDHHRPDLPPYVVSLVMQMLSPTREDRPDSMAAVHRRLLEQTQARGPSRKSAWAAVSIGLAAITGITIAASVHRTGRAAAAPNVSQAQPLPASPQAIRESQEVVCSVVARRNTHRVRFSTDSHPRRVATPFLARAHSRATAPASSRRRRRPRSRWSVSTVVSGIGRPFDEKRSCIPFESSLRSVLPYRPS